VLTTRYLLWTADAGRTWTNITPPAQHDSGTLQAAFFLDAEHGWLASSTRLFATTDDGASWRSMALPTLPSGGMPRLTYAASDLSFVDPSHGWIRFAPSNAIVDPPLLPIFATGDGGQTWRPLSAPRYGWFHFVTASDGWSAGGGQGLIRTLDGGATWQPQPLPVPDAYRSEYVTIAPPTFIDRKNGVLPVVYYTDTNSVVVVYVTADAGQTWRDLTPVADLEQHPFGQDQGISGFIGHDIWVLLFRNSLATSSDRGLHWNRFKATGVESLSDVDYTTANIAWGMGTFKPCAQCSFAWGPVQSIDGGRTWTPLRLP
jgi:photosystem II stability/assembly factor-like uncharacterized protein